MRGREEDERAAISRRPGPRPRSSPGWPAEEPRWSGGGVPPGAFVRRAGYTLACVLSALVMAASGLSYFLVRDVGSLGGSHAIASGPSIGPQNILLMGLESRTDWNGHILPDDVLKALHAGSRQGIENGVGGNATNTLILIHIPAGGKKAVGFSIPRDDWVTFPTAYDGQTQGKIDQAYGLAMAARESQLRQQDPQASQDQVAFAGNEAGRAATVATVEQLTGVHIDHFAEVNLDGFYELARVLGGVEVCLTHPVPYDPYSGFEARHAGYQHLDAAQALAFVRQRHGLPGGDLDRTHRQQAFLDSVLHQLRTEGVLSDLTKIQALLSVAKQYVITDAGWNLLDFATEMRGLSPRNIIFRTLPIQGYATIDGQDANVVNPARLKAIVQAAFRAGPAQHSRTRPAAPKAAPARTITVDVLNGGHTAGLAARVSDALARAGYQAGAVGNTSPRTTTAVLYGAGAAGNASQIAAMFGTAAAASASVPARTVEVLLGASAAVPSTSASAEPPTHPAASPAARSPGGAVSGKGGIPCVN
jgi:LCP family protein required for cell wall assembly